MKKPKFSDSQIIAILKQAEGGTPTPSVERPTPPLTRAPRAQDLSRRPRRVAT